MTGAVGFGAGKLLSKGVEKAAPALKRALRAYSIEKGRQALLGGSKQLAQETPIRPEAIEDAFRADGRFSRAPIGILGSSAGAARRLRARADAKQIVNDEILGTLEDAGVRSLPSSEIARRLAEAGEEASQNTGISGVGRAYRTAARDILSKKSEEFAPGATLGFRQGEKIKSSYQEIARSGYKQRQPPSVPKANMNVARIIREANEEAVDRATQEAPAGSVVREMGEAFVPVKRSLRNTLEALEAAEAGAYRASTRTSDAGSKALSAMAHGVAPTKAAIVGALQELYQGRGASTIAAIANRLGPRRLFCR